MKIGVISDTHISDKKTLIPQAILEGFKTVDMVIHAGDMVDMHVIEQLKKVCPKVIAVCGNMDPIEVRNEFPEKKIISAGKYKIGIMHGIGAPVQLVDLLSKAFKDDKVDIIIFGHSHHPYNEIKGNTLFFNPGSATDKVYAPYNSYGIIEINGRIKSDIIKI